MFLSRILSAGAVSLLAISGASAATFSLDLTGGTATTLDTNYSLPIPTLPYAIIDFQDTGSGFGGLVVSPGESRIKATYMGSEAGATNGAELSFGSFSFSNATSSVGDAVIFDNFGPFVNLEFITDNLGGSDFIENTLGTASDPRLHMAFTDITGATGDVTELFAFFGDGAGDSDYDDMVVKLEILAPVPLPAGVFLLATGVAGFGLMRRRRQVS